MAVVIETTLGDITVDLYLEQRPVTCLNFLKLCKMKYYNFNLFHTIRNGFIAQSGDPTGEGSGGQSIWGILEGPEKRFFSGEKMPKIRHTDAGLLSMVCTDDMMVGSQFFLTLAPDLDSLDGTHCVIGEVTEGREILTKINEVICDENHRPYRDVRITHTVVLEDPFSDPVGLRAPSRSPSPNPERLKGGRIAPDEEIDEMQGRSVEEIQEMIEEKEAKARATILEIVGDLPDAEIAPPENVLFVCKLNPVTTDEDLEIIFSRFGTIVSCEVIKDKKTGNSLQYAFIEFENKKSCEDAYFKMDNVLIDDRRIHVDFSQSVSKMRWLGKGRGVQYFDNDSKQEEEKQDNKDKRRYRNESKKNNRDNRRDEKDNKQEPDRDIKQRHNRDKEETHEKDRERRHNRDREHKYDREREYKYDRDREHRYVRDRGEPNHDRGPRHNRDKEQKNSREEEQNRDREQRQYRENEKRYERDRGNAKQRSRSRSRLNESQKNRQESDTERGNVRKNGNTYNVHNSRSDKLKHSPIRNNRHDFATSRSKEEAERKNSRIDEKYENNHKYSHKKQKGDFLRYSNHTEQHNDYKHTESQKETKRSRQQNEEPLTPSPTLKRKNNKLSNKKIETKSSKKVDKKSNRKKKSRPSTSTSESSSSTSSSDSSSSSESDRKKKKLRRRRKYSSSSSSTESSSSSSSNSSSSSSSSDSDHKKKKLKNKKKNSKNKHKL